MQKAKKEERNNNKQDANVNLEVKQELENLKGKNNTILKDLLKNNRNQNF